MKKIIVSTALLIFANHLVANNTSCESVPFLNQYDCIDLQDLYSKYQKDPLSFKSYGSAFIHSRLTLVEKHIQVIEHAIRPENIWKKRCELACSGLFLTGIFGMGCFIITKEFLQSYAEFSSKKFKKVSIPFLWMLSLPDKQFSSKEKRYLKKFSFETIESRGHSRLVGNMVYTDIWTIDMTKLAPQIREKLNYLALEYNIPIKKKDLIFKGIFSSGALTSTAGFGLLYLYLAFYQKDILKEQLQQAKEVKKFLQSIETSR